MREHARTFLLKRICRCSGDQSSNPVHRLSCRRPLSTAYGEMLAKEYCWSSSGVLGDRRGTVYAAARLAMAMVMVMASWRFYPYATAPPPADPIVYLSVYNYDSAYYALLCFVCFTLSGAQCMDFIEHLSASPYYTQ